MDDGSQPPDAESVLPLPLVSRGSPSSMQVEPPASAAARPLGWESEGHDGALRWKRRRVDDGETARVLLQNNPEIVDPLLKTQLDREIPYNQIPEHQRPEYHAAEKKEWDSWVKAGCVKILDPSESALIRQKVHRSRIIRLRFVYRGKNASVRTPQLDVPL